MIIIQDEEQAGSNDVNNAAGLTFSTSAAEARQKMPKKIDVKKLNLTLQEKHELFEQL